MTKFKIILPAILLVGLASPAFAEDDNCTDVSPASWLSKEQILVKARDLGFDPRRAKVEGSCYEVYALDGKGRRVEAMFDPASGKLVRIKDKS